MHVFLYTLEFYFVPLWNTKSPLKGASRNRVGVRGEGTLGKRRIGYLVLCDPTFCRIGYFKCSWKSLSAGLLRYFPELSSFLSFLSWGDSRRRVVASEARSCWHAWILPVTLSGLHSIWGMGRKLSGGHSPRLCLRFNDRIWEEPIEAAILTWAKRS